MEKEFTALDEHLRELRKRLIRVAAVFVLLTLGGLYIAGPLIRYLTVSGPAAGIALNTFSPWDSIQIYMQVSFFIGLAFSLPYALLELWLFVKPGLKPLEQKAAIFYIPLAAFLFAAGFAFAYLIVFPMAFYFTSSVTKSLGFMQTYGIAQFFSFMFNILLPVALLFELPVVVLFLTKIRVLNPYWLKKIRKAAYLVLIIIAASMTPPDVISDILVAAPLIGLYEVSIFLSWSVYKKQQRLEEGMKAEKLKAG